MKKLVFALMACTSLLATAQMEVDNTPTPEDLVAFLVGEGVEYSNVTFQGDINQFGTFMNANDIGMASGIIMATGDCEFAEGANNTGSGSLGGGNSGDNDPDLDQVSGVNTNDRAVLEFDFVPSGDSLNFTYVFGSEEYDDFECCTVNDAFGFFISGPGITGPFSSPAEFPDGAINIALIPGTDIGVSINTVNSGNANCGEENCSNLDPNWQDNTIYFTSNAGGQEIQYDGFTVPLVAQALVNCGDTYHIKLAIADGGDTVWDSGVMLEEGSFSSSDPGIIPTVDNTGIQIPDNTLVEGCVDGFMTITKPNCDESAVIDITIGGTAGMVADYEFIESQVVFEEGQNSVDIPIITVVDGITEGTETIEISFEYITTDGDTISASAELNIIDYVTLDLQVEDVYVCPESTADAVALIENGIPNYEVDWSNGTTGTTTTFGPGDAGEYYGVVTDFCEEQDTAHFEVFEPGPLVLENIDPFYCLGLDTDALVSGGSPPYTFEFPSDSLILLEGGGFTTDFAGIYDVTIVDACEDTYEFELIFMACDTQIPNVFTPTNSPNDVYNNAFVIDGLAGFPGSSLRVYNRWGNLVYENKNYFNTWDGEENPDGVYYYVFDRSDGETYTGYVHILRKQAE